MGDPEPEMTVPEGDGDEADEEDPWPFLGVVWVWGAFDFKVWGVWLFGGFGFWGFGSEVCALGFGV